MQNITAFILSLSLSLVLQAADNGALIRQISTKAESSGSNSLIISENGKILTEKYFGQTPQVQNVQSVTKSIAALAIMKLLEQKKISSLDLPMSNWIPAWAADAQKSKITLRMLLNHTSGYPDADLLPDFFSEPDIVKTAAETQLIAEPGTTYQYSSVASTLLQTVIAQSAGVSLTDYVQQNIFAPLSIFDAYWRKDRSNHEQTSGGLCLSPQDMLKIGQMMLAKGIFNNQIIITNQDADLLTSKSQNYFNYGLLWWLYEGKNSLNPGLNVFSAYGWGGQYITVYPEKNVIAVRTKDPVTVDLTQLPLHGFPEFPGMISEWK